MNEAKIGVILSSFHLPLEESLKKAAQIGIKGIQLWNVGGELDPRNMPEDKREKFMKKVSSLGLTITALCGDIGGFTEESNVKERIKRTKEFLDLSIDLRAPIVTTHIGIIPKDKNTKERKIMQGALKKLGEYGETLLGEGDVPFEKYIKALKEIDYDGFFTIERETGNNRVADIIKGKEFLEKLLWRGKL